MLQSWDNVALNMHELLTVSPHIQRKSEQYHLPSCMSTVQCTCSSTNFKPISITSLTTPLDAGLQQLLELTTAMVMLFALLERRIYHQSMTKNRPRLSLRSRLGGTWPAEQASWNTRRFVPFVRAWMHLYGHPCLCTQHFNFDQSWAFWTCRRVHLLCPPG